MTKKDYVAIAKIFKENYLIDATLIRELAIYFKQDNPKFEEEKFLRACGL